MLMEAPNLRHTPLVPQAQETTPPERLPLHRLYRQGCPQGAVYNPPKAGNCRKAHQLEKCHGDRDPSLGKPRSQRRQDGHHGILRAAWSTLPRWGEAERVIWSHCEPVSEPVTAPHPPGRLSQAQLTLDLKGLRSWPAAGTTATWPGPRTGFQRECSPGHGYGHREESGDSTCYCSNY